MKSNHRQLLPGFWCVFGLGSIETFLCLLPCDDIEAISVIRCRWITYWSDGSMPRKIHLESGWYLSPLFTVFILIFKSPKWSWARKSREVSGIANDWTLCFWLWIFMSNWKVNGCARVSISPVLLVESCTLEDARNLPVDSLAWYSLVHPIPSNT